MAVIKLDEAAVETALRKAAHEAGWATSMQNVLLTRFIASTIRFRPSLLSEFKQFLADAGKVDPADMSNWLAYAGTDEDDDEEEEDDEDFDDEEEDDEDFDDDEDDDDDFDDE